MPDVAIAGLFDNPLFGLGTVFRVRVRGPQRGELAGGFQICGDSVLIEPFQRLVQTAEMAEQSGGSNHRIGFLLNAGLIHVDGRIAETIGGARLV